LHPLAAPHVVGEQLVGSFFRSVHWPPQSVLVPGHVHVDVAHVAN